MNLNARRNRVWKRVRDLARLVAVAALTAWLVGCGASGPLISEQQSVRASQSRSPPAPEAYRVRRGDTLYSIAFRYGLDWRDVARWNGIGAPYTIHAGDWIRLQPRPDMRTAVVVAESAPSADRAQQPASTAGSRPGSSAAAESRSGAESEPSRQDVPDETEVEIETTGQDSSPSGGGEQTSSESAPEPNPASNVQPTEAGDPPPAPTRSAGGVSWRWPASGRVKREFDASAARKGILVAGEGGQPIRAAAEGEVVYSGDGLIGYGELIIIKHSERMLSAYAHNRERLVSEGDRVVSGALIARMGINERAETVLHFEIRRDGKPTNPLDYLPRR